MRGVKSGTCHAEQQVGLMHLRLAKHRISSAMRITRDWSGPMRIYKIRKGTKANGITRWPCNAISCCTDPMKSLPEACHDICNMIWQFIAALKEHMWGMLSVHHAVAICCSRVRFRMAGRDSFLCNEGNCSSCDMMMSQRSPEVKTQQMRLHAEAVHCVGIIKGHLNINNEDHAMF